MMTNLFVYSGSSLGKFPAYLTAAEALGKESIRREITLVYGSARIVIMGAIADTVLQGGGKVLGVIPQPLLKKKEISHTGLTELFVVGSMHTRKAKTAELSDGFVALP